MLFLDFVVPGIESSSHKAVERRCTHHPPPRGTSAISSQHGVTCQQEAEAGEVGIYTSTCRVLRLIDHRTPESLASDQLQALTILAEVLGTSDTPGSVDLISRLLETLDKVIHAKGLDTSDTNYVCQMLMAAIERSASKMTVWTFALQSLFLKHFPGTLPSPYSLGSSTGTHKRLLPDLRCVLWFC